MQSRNAPRQFKGNSCRESSARPFGCDTERTTLHMRILHWLGSAVPRQVLAVFFVLAVAEIAHSQVIPGDSVDTGIGAATRNSRTRPLLGISHDRQKVIYVDDYGDRTSRQREPVRKPSTDPWKGVRSTGSADSLDRHRAQ
jgi:hypothetical protein